MSEAGVGLLIVAGLLVLALTVDWFSRLRSFQCFGRIVNRLRTTERIVALTFDDGPNPPHTEQILAVLNRRQVRATFFLVGRYVQLYPDTVRRIAGAGHDIGNHSYSHRRLIFKHPRFVRREIVLTDRALRRAGVAATASFRAPNCRKLVVLPYVLLKMGRLHVSFDVLPSPSEYYGAPADVVSRYVLRHVRPGSIVVLHDGAHDRPRDRSNVIEATDLILDGLISAGYRFVTVRELLGLGR